MSLLGKLAAQIRSYPSAAAAYLLSRLTAVEDSVSGLAADGGPYTCLAGDAVLDAVYLSAADTIALADADNASKIPAVGILISKDSDTEANVRFAGVVSGFVGLTAGAIYYLSATAGDITATPPSAPHAAPIGIAVSTTKLLVVPLGVMSAVLKSTVANLGASVIGIQDALALITAATVEGALAELAQFKADLGSVSANKGGTLVAYEDSGSKTTAATVDAALDEIYLDRLSTSRSRPIDLGAWREVSAGGDVGDVAGIGGVLASDTAPILRGDANGSWEISWATGNVDPIGIQIMLPADFDDTGNAILDFDVYSGPADAMTLGVATSWNGGAEVTDSADDAGTKSATRHRISATVAHADIPAGATHLSVRITPPAHATDAFQLVGAQLRYTPKLLT